MRRHAQGGAGKPRLALIFAAGLALALPAIGVADPPTNAPGQSGSTPANGAPPPGQSKKDPQNPANHNPPAPDQSNMPQDRGDGANGCTGSVKTTAADGSVVDGNMHAIGDPVYVSGSNFPASTTFNFEVTDVQSKTAVASGSFAGGADGSFLQQVVQDPSLSGHEYKVIVYYDTASGHRCHKSDNFFFVGGKDKAGMDRVIICAATGSKKHPYNELTLPTAAVQNRHRKPGDIIPAPEGGCPTTAEVKAVERTTTPQQARSGQKVTVHVKTVPNAVVSITGAGVLQSRIASRSGLVTLTVTPKRAGVLVVKGASLTSLARIGVLGARTSGRSLTG